MPYSRPYASGFVDYPSTTTPINSTALNTMDLGIKTANDQFQSVTTAQRTALTPTVGQCVWDSDLRQLMVFMNASGGNAWQPIGNRIICTSTTRPSTPFHGQVIYETDSKKEFVYNGTAWVQTNSASTTSGVTGVSNLIVPPACSLYHSATQNIANATYQAVVFNSENFDTDAMHDTSTNTSRVTVNTAGLYQVSGYVTYNNNATGTRNLYVYINGASAGNQQVASRGVTRTDGGAHTVGLSGLVSLSVGDYIELVTYQTSGGGALSLTAHTAPDFPVIFQAAWVGRAS